MWVAILQLLTIEGSYLLCMGKEARGSSGNGVLDSFHSGHPPQLLKEKGSQCWGS